MDHATRGILAVARGVLEELDIELVLDRLLETARDLTGARHAAVRVRDDARGGRPATGSFLEVPITIDRQPYGHLYLTDKQGGAEFSDEDEETAVLLADVAGLAIGHARRSSGSEAKRTQLQQTVRALDATIQIARALGGETDLHAILELVAERGRALVSARILIIELLSGDGLELAAGAGTLPAGLIGRRVALADTVASAALRTGQTQRLTDPVNRARFQEHGIGHLGLSAENGLIVPLVFRDRPYGVLVALDHLDGADFTAEHLQLLEAFAASAATAVATAHSAADERGRQRLAAAEAERGRWARELHDETLQALGNLRLTLAAAKRSADPVGLVDAVGQALVQLESDIATLRSLITELRPAALDQLGLEPALLALIDRGRTGGLDVDAHVELTSASAPSGGRLASELETGVYRIVQEALTNAVKHGRAGRASVEVLEHGQQVSVTVRDDGAGFDPEASTNGFGLTGMHERAELLGGDVTVRSTPGAGTTVSATFPVTRRQ